MQISFQDDCPNCNSCCWNERPTLTVLFTEQERARLHEAGISPLPKFIPYKGSTSVFSVELVTMETEHGQTYVCPFQDYNAHRCTIYALRPFDCRLWPFFFSRHAGSGKVFFSCYTGVCPAVDKLPHITRQMIGRVPTPKTLALLQAFPDLIWEDPREMPYCELVEVGELLGITPSRYPSRIFHTTAHHSQLR